MKDPATLIKNYILKKEYSIRQFAKLCGISKVTIYNCYNTGKIRGLTAQKIEDATDGDLKFEDLTDYNRPASYFTRVRVSSFREKMKNLL